MTGQSRIVLAGAPPFRLGALEVTPASREVSRDCRRELLEPRVMQVLVALAEAQGAIVGRDTLIERCWNGQVVGDNAINRVISRLRRLAEGLGRNCYRVDTVTKVGYRLVATSPVFVRGSPVSSTDPAPAASRFRRRTILAGGAALAGAGLGTAWIARRHRPDPVAATLIRRGSETQRGGLVEHTRQGIAFFRRATEIDPTWAAAWGALALGYRHLLGFSGDDELDRVVRLCRDAAARAFALDRDDVEATIAVKLIPPYLGHWRQQEQDLEGLRVRFPDHWLPLGALGQLRLEVGRWHDALPPLQELIVRDPLLPISHGSLTIALWNAGRLEEAERISAAALRTWPGHPYVWSTRFLFLALSGRTGAAAALAADSELRPVDEGPVPFPFSIVRHLLAGLEGGAPNRAAAVAALREGRARRRLPSPLSALLLATFGDVDAAFATIEPYLLAPHHPLSRRTTAALFYLRSAPLRADPRFASLTNRLGLEDYWRESGTHPDYRL